VTRSDHPTLQVDPPWQAGAVTYDDGYQGGYYAGPEEPEPPRKRQRSRADKVLSGILAGGIVLLLCGVPVALGVSFLASAGDRDPMEARADDALVTCQQFVTDRLKAPSTAEFSGHEIINADPQWTVRGAVDAQNGFGAMLRSNYVCTVTLTPDGKTWQLNSLDLITP
jgi:hypothetical protein